MKKLFRDAEVNWRVESHREASVREVLEDPERAGEDEAAQAVGTVTLLAGGVMHQLNLLGGEIWKLCDGTLDRKGVVGRLMALFEVEEQTLAADVDLFLEEMMRKGLIHER
ncbi:MAG: PqqD family peptide modification chaperone [bacterium]|nr:MAG: PqqD family peptide modification chaperone [bacterium]